MKLNSAKGQAPGRLDFMGGVADYSGSLVLQMPIKGVTTVTARKISECNFIFQSEDEKFRLESSSLIKLLNDRADLKALRAALDKANPPFWTRYLLGSLLVFCSSKKWLPPCGLRFSVSSTVPQSMGVSSSAALEIASLRCMAQLAEKSFVGTELARMGQTVENFMVGAPCGLMDQLASSFGKAGHLLPILCRPDQLGGPRKLPANTLVVGWPSGIKHAVSGSPYARARCAAFMGKAILERETQKKWNFTSEISPSLLNRKRDQLPVELSGAEFLNSRLSISDPISAIHPNEIYPVRDSTAFAINENFRCHVAASLLNSIDKGPEINALIGELMFQSHEGYGAMGLGCPEVDRMVDAIKAEGSRKGFYGARISGGGCGGTVALFIHRKALPRLKILHRSIRFHKEPLPLIF